MKNGLQPIGVKERQGKIHLASTCSFVSLQIMFFRKSCFLFYGTIDKTNLFAHKSKQTCAWKMEAINNVRYIFPFVQKRSQSATRKRSQSQSASSATRKRKREVVAAAAPPRLGSASASASGSASGSLSGSTSGSDLGSG